MVERNQAHDDLERAARILVLAATKDCVRLFGGRKKIRSPRVIPISQRGGFLPILSGLLAIGGLTGGVASVVKAYKDTKRGYEQLEEAIRHNRTMEAISLGKRGSGLYLKPYRKDLGLYLKQSKNF